jgi:hypothetical protein
MTVMKNDTEEALNQLKILARGLDSDPKLDENSDYYDAFVFLSNYIYAKGLRGIASETSGGGSGFHFPRSGTGVVGCIDFVPKDHFY